MAAPDEAASVLDAVGRRGAVEYAFERDGTRTILTRASCSSPWHYVPPIHQDETGCAYTWLVNPSGGLVGGDEVTVAADLGPGSHALFTSPSATRVYRTLGEPAVQRIRLSVGAGARLEWLPDVTIPFAGARFRQTLHVRLGEGASAIVWDALASGRIARHERWAFDAVENEVRISTASGAAVLERYQIGRQTMGWSMKAWDYVATLFVIAEGRDAAVWARLTSSLRDLLVRCPGEALGGVSEPAAPGLAVKVLARTAPALTGLLEALAAEVRRQLWGLPPVVFRRY